MPVACGRRAAVAGPPCHVGRRTVRAVRACARRCHAADHRGVETTFLRWKSPTATVSASPIADAITEPIVQRRSRQQGQFVAKSSRELGPTPQLLGMLADRSKSLGPLGLDAQWVVPPRRPPGEMAGDGGSNSPIAGPGAASPRWRHRRCHWRIASPPVIRWAMMVGTSSWNSIWLAPKRTTG